MDQKQPLEVIGNDLVSIQMIPGQKEQKLSKKAKNSQLAITLSSSSEMNSFFVTNDNFCMQKQWPVQKNKLNFFAQKKLDFLVPLLLIFSRIFPIFQPRISIIVICLSNSERTRWARVWRAHSL